MRDNEDVEKKTDMRIVVTQLWYLDDRSDEAIEVLRVDFLS